MAFFKIEILNIKELRLLVSNLGEPDLDTRRKDTLVLLGKIAQTSASEHSELYSEVTKEVSAIKSNKQYLKYSGLVERVDAILKMLSPSLPHLSYSGTIRSIYNLNLLKDIVYLLKNLEPEYTRQVELADSEARATSYVNNVKSKLSRNVVPLARLIGFVSMILYPIILINLFGQGYRGPFTVLILLTPAMAYIVPKFIYKVHEQRVIDLERLKSEAETSLSEIRSNLYHVNQSISEIKMGIERKFSEMEL